MNDLQNSDKETLIQIIREQNQQLESFKKETFYLRNELKAVTDRESMSKELQSQLQTELRQKADFQVTLNNLKRQLERSLPFIEQNLDPNDALECTRALVTNYIQTKKNLIGIQDERKRSEELLASQRSMLQKIKTEKLQLENELRSMESHHSLLKMQIQSLGDDSERYKKLCDDLQRKMERFYEKGESREGASKNNYTSDTFGLRALLNQLNQNTVEFENEWRNVKMPRLEQLIDQIKKNTV